ncbi:hypothetical protein CYMTET_10876 [Cymbomonas tetramitiformis]|uniref:NAD-dependent epimerase/dehydratase domain-containing protein n=1 Tax=Cymbomonas tetramitiformis TaxID=36881 RepID=A0AAE0LDJ9_9CHLO|nr:hypothetical protein CYMTET_10876 [Cymbomonas tetramitiformis]
MLLGCMLLAWNVAPTRESNLRKTSSFCKRYSPLATLDSKTAYPRPVYKSAALVTGGAGFIGSHVALHAVTLGLEVVVLDDLSGGFHDNIPLGAKFIQCDLKDLDAVEEIFRKYKFEYVFHLAAYAAEGLSHFIRSYNYRNNLVATVGLINAAVRQGTVRCFVFTSSIAVYGANQVPFNEDTDPKPEDPYGIAKYACELDLTAANAMFKLDYIIFRPHNVYGPGQNMYDKYRNVVGIFLNQLSQNKAMSIFGDGSQTRKFSYIDDVSKPLVKSITVRTAYNQIFNVGADDACSVQEVAQVTAAAWNVTADIVHLAARNEVHHAESAHVKFRCFFPEEATPVPLEVGLVRMARWVKARGQYLKPVEFTAVEVKKGMPVSWSNSALREVAQVEHTSQDKVFRSSLEPRPSQTSIAPTFTRKFCPQRGVTSLAVLDPKKLGFAHFVDSTVGRENLAAADAFQQRLCSLQFSHPSSQVMVLADDGSQDATHCGIGCRFLRQTAAFWVALNNNQRVLSPLRGEWTYTDASSCKERNNDCYFAPLSSAVQTFPTSSGGALNVLNSTASRLLPEHSTDLQRQGIQVFTRSSLDEFRGKQKFGIPWMTSFPETTNKSGCWVAGQLLFFLLQPNQHLENRLAAEKQRMGWSGNCAAIHVRHGWRNRFNRNVSMESFLHRLRSLNISNILLITEDQAVIDEALTKFPAYRWLYTNYPRNNPHDIGVEMEKGKMDPTAEAYNALINLLLSSECDYFAGRTNSTWYRLMLLLSYGRYGYFPPWDNVGEDWGHGGLRKWGFFGLCTLGELRKEVSSLNLFLPNSLRLDINKIL